MGAYLQGGGGACALKCVAYHLALSCPSFFVYGASNFNQNLCNWGNIVNNLNKDSVFTGTACPDTGSPDYTVTPKGPFCHPCL